MKKLGTVLLTSFSLLLILSMVTLSCSKKDGSDGPKISSISPSSALTGATITITGSNLSGSTVDIGGIGCHVDDNTATSIITSIPAGAATGEQQVLVQNALGKATSKITVTGAGAGPVITSITPAEVATGETITINGTGLGNATVQIYKKLATVTASTATSIKATVPAGIPAGQAAVDVTTALGHVVSTVIIK
jgi:hypothetical protein